MLQALKDYTAHSLLLFRSRKENRLIHSCPLFWIPGVTIRSWVVDIMHSWHLGDLLTFIAHVFWYIIGLGILCPPSHQLDTEERHRLSLLRLKSELFEHYRTKRKDPDFRQSCSEDLCFLHKVEYKVTFLLTCLSSLVWLTTLTGMESHPWHAW